MAEALLNHLNAQQIPITRERATGVYAMGDYFNVLTPKHQYEGSCVILATGMSQKASFSGEQEFLGRGVSYCATCDAALYRGKRVVVVGYHNEAWEEAKYLAEIAKDVYYIPMDGTTPDSGGNIQVLCQKPTAIEGDGRAERMITKEGTLEADGFFILRDSVAPRQLVPGLEMEEGHVRVDLNMQTNLPGLFACGDIAGKPYQYIKAAGQGNVAALSAVAYLQNKRKIG